MKKIICYHHNDHDGIVAAAVLVDYYKRVESSIPLDFRMVDYSCDLELEDIDADEVQEVFFLDYSFSGAKNYENLIRLHERFKMEGKGSNIYWIDHHKSSIDKDIPEISGYRSNRYCGAVLTWLFLNTSNVNFQEVIEHGVKLSKVPEFPVFLKYIDDYDCWKKQFPETNDIHYGFNVIDPQDPVFRILLWSSNKEKALELIEQYKLIGAGVKKYLEFENNNYHVNMYGFKVNFCGYNAFALNRKGNSLMFGNLVDKYDIVIPFYYNGLNGQWNYSLFTNRDNLDVEELAVKFGGGGHRQAAGFQTDKCIFENCNYAVDTFTKIINAPNT